MEAFYFKIYIGMNNKWDNNDFIAANFFDDKI